jgi:hypothetical protein
MQSRIKENQKRRRGRPATGRDPAVTARIPAEAIEVLDNWARSEGITRGEAIRRLIAVGLEEMGKK